jgi:hypothetical protein
MKHNIVYKITNIINGKWYIGVHRTSNLNDGYMGSGDVINRAVEKYGIDNFTKEILFDFENEKDAYLKEAKLITIDEVRNPNCYNIHTGGKGGWSDSTIALTHIYTKSGWIPKEQFNPKIHEGMAKNQIVVKDSNGNKTRVYRDDPRYLSGELVPWNQGISQPIETNIKRSEALKGKVYQKYYCSSCNKEVAIVYKRRHESGGEHLKGLLAD